MISGNPKVNWMDYTMARKFFVKHPPEKFSVLSLSCGSGALERSLASTGMFGCIEGIDISEGSIRIAREEAAKANLPGLSYMAADLNHVALGPKKYDAVVSASALHHIKNLERLLNEIGKPFIVQPAAPECGEPNRPARRVLRLKSGRQNDTRKVHMKTRSRFFLE